MDSNPFPVFPGDTTHALAFRAWITDVYTIADNLGTRPHGLLGYIMSDDEWLAINDNQPFIPIAPPAADPPGQATQWSQWKHESDAYKAETQLVRTMRGHILQCIDEHASNIVKGNATSLIGIPLCTIFERLRAEFGTLTRMDILKNKCAASEPYVHGTRIIDYINVHLRIHRIAASNGQPINEVDKVTAFIDGKTPCGLFKDCINAFFVAHPDVPTQLFSTLASDVRKCASNLEPDATSASHGFAAAVATNAQHGSAAAATTAATPFLSPADIAVIVQALQHVQPRNNQRQ